MCIVLVKFRDVKQIVSAHWNAKPNTFLWQIVETFGEGVEIRQVKPLTKIRNSWRAEANESSLLSECHEYGLLCVHSWSRCLVQWISDVASWGQISALWEIIQQLMEFGSCPPASGFFSEIKHAYEVVRGETFSSLILVCLPCIMTFL